MDESRCQKLSIQVFEGMLELAGSPRGRELLEEIYQAVQAECADPEPTGLTQPWQLALARSG